MVRRKNIKRNRTSFDSAEVGDLVTFNDSSVTATKHLELGKMYEVVRLEMPSEHFRGRWVVVCEDGKERAFYPNRFI